MLLEPLKVNKANDVIWDPVLLRAREASYSYPVRLSLNWVGACNPDRYLRSGGFVAVLTTLILDHYMKSLEPLVMSGTIWNSTICIYKL
ncbi:hypothetical protein SAMN06265368_2203 [Cohaesibacter gelatinilyticus]|uniref:Uncharacterized protein n=1 Tax=Cohaesibacter gelatinilyticus TaxID=372072 RepID=A0A285PD34_9HYPH|nr:hypothetical protein SAMN06265368_2203 [Cohaesibacter gelatinilyticus]